MAQNLTVSAAPLIAFIPLKEAIICLSRKSRNVFLTT
jgi:hypothetical protein